MALSFDLHRLCQGTCWVCSYNSLDRISIGVADKIQPPRDGSRFNIRTVIFILNQIILICTALGVQSRGRSRDDISDIISCFNCEIWIVSTNISFPISYCLG
jgi:hypothetical protein